MALTQVTQAAGRILSQKNINRLKGSFVDLGKMLIDAGAIAPADLGSLFQEVADSAEEDGPSSVAVEASSLKTDFHINAWQNNLKEALRLFEYRARDIFIDFADNEAYLRNNYGDGKTLDKKTIGNQLISDLNEILVEIFAGLPETPQQEAYVPGYYTPPPVSVYAEAAETTVEDTAVVSAEESVKDAAEDDPKPEVPKVDTIKAEASDVVVPAPAGEIRPDISIELELVFDRQIEVLAAEKRDNNKQSSQANKRPIKGVLFRVDEASETAPSKGSEYPLYIPRTVAEEALVAINASEGLPLDADPSLTKHANDKIVGIMVAAEILDKDFIVQGHLFHWNQQERVDAIADNHERLGMSLNAHASGQVTEIDGTDVFCLSHLDILGANILLKDRATYQKTRLILSEIAASSANAEQLNTEEKNMEPLEQRVVELKDTLAQIRDASTREAEKAEQRIAEISAASARESENAKRQIEELTVIVQKQHQLISEIEEERKEAQRLVQAQAAERAKEEDTKALILALGNQMSQTLDEKLAQQRAEMQKELLDAINPTRSPRRITQPLVSVAAEGAQQQPDAMKHRLLVAEAQLDVMEKNSITGPSRFQLIDEIRDLRAAQGM
jgi:hypothetical protein